MSSNTIERRFNKEELAKLGDAIFANEIRSKLTSDDNNKFAAIDIESGLYELDFDELRACDRLRARMPKAQIWLVRIGSPYLHRFGGRDRLDNP